MTTLDGPGVLLVGQGACGKDPKALPALRIGEAVEAGAFLEIDVVWRQRAVHARPSQPGVVAPRHRTRVSAVAQVPDAEQGLVVRQHRRRRMRMVLVRFRQTAGDDNLPLRVFGEVDVDQCVALPLPKRFLFCRRGFPCAFGGLGGVCDFGLRLGKGGQRRAAGW